jgi:hypothetical protein
MLQIRAVRILNKHEDLGLEATKGPKLLAMTWAVTVLMLVCCIPWPVDWCIEKRRRKSYLSRSLDDHKDEYGDKIPLWDR